MLSTIVRPDRDGVNRLGHHLGEDLNTILKYLIWPNYTCVTNYLSDIKYLSHKFWDKRKGLEDYKRRKLKLDEEPQHRKKNGEKKKVKQRMRWLSSFQSLILGL